MKVFQTYLVALAWSPCRLLTCAWIIFDSLGLSCILTPHVFAYAVCNAIPQVVSMVFSSSSCRSSLQEKLPLWENSYLHICLTKIFINSLIITLSDDMVTLCSHICSLPGLCAPVLISEPIPLLFLKIYLFHLFYFWLRWVFVAAHGLSLAAASGGYSSLRCAGFSLRWLLLLQSMGSRHGGFSSCGSRALECRLSSCGARA